MSPFSSIRTVTSLNVWERTVLILTSLRYTFRVAALAVAVIRTGVARATRAQNESREFLGE
jgi:hypothetical protein